LLRLAYDLAMAPLPFDRTVMLERLRSETFDVLVIGGGITGVGVALDAASRGLKTALVERDDFSSGTSSKSSKLAHGGLRYLQQGEIGLVYEALHERQRLLHNAAHLVRILPFLIPIMSSGGVLGRKLGFALGKSMWLYDLTGGARIGKKHKKLNNADTLAHMPTMAADKLAGGYLYYDATVDDARLCLTVARTAVHHGAVAANYTNVVALTRAGTALSGATVEADGQQFDVRATVVVNAAGVWSDQVRTFDEGKDPDAIRPAKGIHITVPWDKVRNDVAVVIPVPGEKRTLFVVPWLPKPEGGFTFTYVGTTDTDYQGPLEDPDYVLNALNHAITTNVTHEDVLGVWAGLRPLVKSVASGRTADLSRGHKVNDRPDGVITITGGKLTTYRHMASDTVDHIVKRLGRGGKSRTASLKLLGAEGYTVPPSHSARTHLDERFGTERGAIDAMIAADPTLGAPLVPGLPYVKAEARYSVRHEMARTLDDVLTRRTRARLQDARACIAAASDVAHLLAPDLGWDAARIHAEVARFCESVKPELVSEPAQRSSTTT
jgi:glycerol-3-phosphate dehydrogenase